MCYGMADFGFGCATPCHSAIAILVSLAVGTVLRLERGPVEAKWQKRTPPPLVYHVFAPSRQLLVDKTDQLNQQAFRFDRASRSLRRTMYWRKIKTGVAAAAVGVVLILAAGATACGGVTFSHCRS